MLILERNRAQISKSGVEPARVVDLVDKARKIGCDIGEGFIGHQVYRLHLERFHEALGFGVVIRISAPAHRTDQAMIGKDPAVELGGILLEFNRSSQQQCAPIS